MEGFKKYLYKIKVSILPPSSGASFRASLPEVRSEPEVKAVAVFAKVNSPAFGLAASSV